MLKYSTFGHKKAPARLLLRGPVFKGRRLPALPQNCSTIGAIGLNFSVRNGKRWIPNAITALIL
ncbi:hypothetical protein PSM36_2624 [Proteiniphilum saccharofermentans]|uniref:Uncharacterized protein n=1 Tax=Proteiniphilum saccharofermentans TaxID=1642647 RepID=A0A1R3TBR3_9BACT|nr:hypothetical protein PSM36_2624 [Proteiniphilum saccharofermentans]